MLRISIRTLDPSSTVTLEGRLVGAWIEELRACWQNLRRSEARPIRVNLDGVTFVDAAGEALLRAMHADGAVLMASTLMMRAVVEEITTARGGGAAARRPAQR